MVYNQAPFTDYLSDILLLFSICYFWTVFHFDFFLLVLTMAFVIIFYNSFYYFIQISFQILKIGLLVFHKKATVPK